MNPLKTLVPIKGKEGAEKFANKYGTGFRVISVGISTNGVPTVVLIRINDWFSKKPYGDYGEEITIERRNDGIYIDGSKFCTGWGESCKRS